MKSRLEKFFRSDFSIALFFYSAFFLLWCRVDLFFGVWRTSDETGYLNRIDRILKVFFPVHESMYDRMENFYAPGAPIAWLPGATLSKIISPALPGEAWNWHWAFTSIYSSLFFIPLFLLALKVCEELSFIPKKQPGSARAWSSSFLVLMILGCTQILHYSFHRVLMSHVVELTFTLATVYALFKNRFTLAFFCASYVCLTRFNDAPIFGLIVARYLDDRKITVSFRAFLDFVRSNLVLSLFILAVTVWVFRVAFVTGYSKFTISEILIGVSSWDVFYFFMAPDWGILWLLPFWVSGFFLALVHFQKLSWMGRAGIVWWVLEVFICVAWRNNGSDLGQRYLIGSTIGVLIAWSDVLKIYGETALRRFRVLGYLNAVWIVLLSTAFFTIETTYCDNKFFMVDAVQAFFNPSFYRKVFELSGVGTIYYSITQGSDQALIFLKRIVSDVKIEGLRAFYVMFALQLVFLLFWILGHKTQKSGNETHER